MNPLKNVEILDCTLRDGSYPLGFRFTAGDTETICSALDEAGLRYVEVGHGVSLGACRHAGLEAAETDEAYLRAARRALPRARMGAFFVPHFATLDDMREARSYGLDFIRIGADISRPEGAREAIIEAKRLGLEVSVNFMRSYAFGLERFLEAALQAERWGADTLCVVDTAGCMLPEEVASYVGRLRDASKAQVGFHGHDNLTLAVANSAAAVRAGASIVDASLRGIGRSAGNAPTETLLAVLRRMGCDLPYDMLRITAAAEQAVAPLIKPQSLDSIEMLCGLARVAWAPGGGPERILESSPGIDLKRLLIHVASLDCANPTMELLIEEARRADLQDPPAGVAKASCRPPTRGW